MCLGVPGQIIEVNGNTAVTDFWGKRKSVKLDSLGTLVVPGDYILNHAGSAVRRIDPELVAETMALYEVLLCEAGEDPMATDIVDELEEADIPALVTTRGTVMTHPTVLWEITRACALECTHCPNPEDDGRSGSEELSTYEAYKTVDQIASLAPRQFIITGGDPLARPDLLQIIEYAKRRGLEPAVALSSTPNLTRDAIDSLRTSGAATLIFALNGSSPLRHDTLSGYPGSFQQTLEAVRTAITAGLAVEIDTLLTHRNISDMNALAGVLGGLGIEAWNVHFIVPIGNARRLEILTPEEAERAFELLATVQRNNRFRVRTVEAPEYRRYLLQNRSDTQWADFGTDEPAEIADCSIDDVVFIGAAGAVRPSEFLPIAAGNIRFRPLFGIVRGSDLFVAFHDRANLTGKCARCEFKEICGGSRARAWAMTGVLFGPDPLCVYQPKRTSQEVHYDQRQLRPSSDAMAARSN